MAVKMLLKDRIKYLQWELETYGESEEVQQQLTKTKKLLEKQNGR